MDLREFINETISGIIDATADLQEKYEELGVVVNPPASSSGPENAYEEDSVSHTFRRVELVEFDVAVTASSETGGGGKAGIRILSTEAGLDGQHSRRNENVSRVKLTIPLALKPSTAESENRAKSKKASGRQHKPRAGIV